MAKYLVVGDVHLTRRRLPRSKLLMEKISQEIAGRPYLRGIVLLGDVFDTHDIQDNESLTIYSRFIRENENRLEIHHLLGNHEMNDSKTYLPEVHALNPWHARKNVFIHDKCNLVEIDGARVVFAPFFPEGNFRRGLTEALGDEAAKIDLIFAHQEFFGCTMGSNQTSVSRDAVLEIPVISGHIHGAQKIGNTWYPGTPCQHNFSEEEEKFIYVIDIKDGGYTVEERIDLGMPKFRTIKTTAGEFPFVDAEDGNTYRIVVRDTPENILLYKRTDFYREMHKSVKFKFDIIKTQAERVENEKNLSFEQRLLELIDEEDLRETYENIFKELPKPS